MIWPLNGHAATRFCLIIPFELQIPNHKNNMVKVMEIKGDVFERH